FGSLPRRRLSLPFDSSVNQPGEVDVIAARAVGHPLAGGRRQRESVSRSRRAGESNLLGPLDSRQSAHFVRAEKSQTRWGLSASRTMEIERFRFLCFGFCGVSPIIYAAWQFLPHLARARLVHGPAPAASKRGADLRSWATDKRSTTV